MVACVSGSSKMPATVRIMPRTVRRRVRHQVFDLLIRIKASKRTPRARAAIPESNSAVFICLAVNPKSVRLAMTFLHIR